MSYVPVGISEEEHREKMLDLRRREVQLQEAAAQSSKADRFWSIAGTVVSVAIPAVTFLGLASWFKIGENK